jgi:hypothetical protein
VWFSVSTLVAPGSVAAPLPFRLRTVLGLLLLVFVFALALPRARAVWRLHGLANKVADYGVCMAGPTGAIAIRDDVTRFRVLVRRRLVASAAADLPFARCGALAVGISGRSELERSHAQVASDFIEWGGGGQRQSINELLSSLPDLQALHARSWPFARKPLADLMRPSRGAFAAVHPMDLPRPTSVRGLVLDGAVTRSSVETPKGRFLVLSNERDVWALRSRDMGHSWTATSAWQSNVDGHAYHCVGDTGGTRYALAPARSGAAPALLYGSMTALGTDRHEFGMPNDGVVRIACDDTGAVTLVERHFDHTYRIYACPIGASCREVQLPQPARQKDVLLDVARIAHTIVIAQSRDGLVRVMTTRDEGASLTPLSLVFDARDASIDGLEPRLVPALLGIGKHLDLVLSVKGTAPRWALGSDDFGASFHAL